MSDGNPSAPPEIRIKRFAWDGWEAWYANCPLIRAKANSAIGALETVMEEFRRVTEAERGVAL